MPETKSKPSAKSAELAMTWFVRQYNRHPIGPVDEYVINSLAHLIDAALATLMQAAKDHADACSSGDECALAMALAPWEPESGGGE